MKFKRTHNCGELTAADAGKETALSGWIENKRDHGGMLFIDLKDRYGITQAVFDPQKDEALHAEGKELPTDWAGIEHMGYSSWANLPRKAMCCNISGT